MLLQGGNFIPESSFEWINLFSLAILCQVGGQYFITHGIGKIPASDGSIGLLMQPLTATILAVFLFNEILNFMQIIFVVLTMFGIYLARLNIAGTEAKHSQ